MRKTLFITILLLLLAIIVVGLVIWSDKQSVIEPMIVEDYATTTVTQLPPIPQNFKEIVLDSGLRFGIPERWNNSHTNNDDSYSYTTDDYIQETVTDRVGEGSEPTTDIHHRLQSKPKCFSIFIFHLFFKTLNHIVI